MGNVARVYQNENGSWCVLLSGMVAIGNGRTAFGCIKEISCADEDAAIKTAQFYNNSETFKSRQF